MTKASMKKAAAASLACLALTAAFLTRPVEGFFSIDFLDVGQGDAILVQTPSDIRMLIDGGPKDNILHALGEVLPFGDKRIDLVILTHPDADHLEGLIPVLRQYNVKAVIKTRETATTAAYRAFTETIASVGAVVQEVNWGDKITTDDGMEFTILWPPHEELTLKPNEASVVGQMRYGGYSFFFTGDIGEPTEITLSSYIKDEYLRSDILKVGHHGSKYSTSAMFLKEVMPRVSVISSGSGNTYGHPTQEVLTRLKEVKSEILRTDLNGTVRLKITKEGLLVKTTK